MRALAALLCAFAIAGTAFAQHDGPVAGDDAAVRDVVIRYMAARERRDPDAIRALFTDDADQYTTAGEWRRGKDNVVRGALASSERNPGSRRIEVQAVRFVTPGIALVDGAYQIGTTQAGGTRPMWTTLLIVKVTDGWRIAAIRNAAPR